MNDRNIIATWFVGDTDSEATEFPQVGGKSSSTEFQRVYWRCIVVFFFCARRQYTDAKLILFLSAPLPNWAEEFEVLLARMCVEIRIVRFRSRPPLGFTKRFGNQLYIVDILEDQSRELLPDQTLCVLDSDCVIRSAPSDFFTNVRRLGCLTYDMRFSEVEDINGISEREMLRVSRDEGFRIRGGRIHYCGGEFVAVSGEFLAKNVRILRDTYDSLVMRWQKGQVSIKEEAHLLSIWYNLCAVEIGTANRYIRRIWTTFKYRDVKRDDLVLMIWHLPAEKKSGFYDLYNDIVRLGVADLLTVEGPKLERLLKRRLGLPSRGPRKLLKDLIRKGIEKAGLDSRKS